MDKVILWHIIGYIFFEGHFHAKKLGDAVRNYFSERIKETMPEFKLIKFNEMPKNTRLYCCEITSNFSFYILLVISPYKDDRFTIEIAWSEKGHFPINQLPSYPYDEPRDGGLRFRLADLWGEKHDHWWWVGREIRPDEFIKMSADEVFEMLTHEEPLEESMKEVQPQVDDAINRIMNMPFPDGRLLGGIECKTGGSSYPHDQFSKDQWLMREENYPGIVVVRDGGS